MYAAAWSENNVGERPTRWAARYPEDPYVKYDDLTLSKDESNRRINRLAHASRKSASGRGLASCAHGQQPRLTGSAARPEQDGCDMVPLNFRLPVTELENILGDAESLGLIYSLHFAENAQALKRKVAGMSHLVRKPEEGDASYPLYEDLIAGKSEREPVPDAKITLDDVQFIMYASGTTGKPKGAAILHGNTRWSAINSKNM